MSSSEEENSQQTSKTHGSIATWGLGLALITLVGLALFGDRGVVRAYDVYRTRLAVEAEIKALRHESQVLRRDISLLKNPKSSHIEFVARTELGMVRDNELIYQLPAKN